MAMVMTAVGLPILLELERSYLNGLWYGLYTNNYTPVVGSTLINFTEVVDAGYTATGRQHPAFTAATLNGSNYGEVISPDLTWSFDHATGDFTIYGYFVSTAFTAGSVIYAERAATPFTVTANGQIYMVSPKKLMGTM